MKEIWKDIPDACSGEHGRSMSCLERFFRRMFNMNENKLIFVDANKAVDILQKGDHDYYSLASLSGSTGIAPEVLQSSLPKDGRVRVSIIKDLDGSPLYTLNSRIGLVKDVWNAVRHISYLSTK